jgi:hypothetical protein
MYCKEPQQQQQEAQLDALHDLGQQHDPAREGIWHLLLGQLWTPLDQAAVLQPDYGSSDPQQVQR